MRIGIWEEVRNPPPWRVPWTQAYEQTMARIELAEQVGLSGVWFTEHHGYADGQMPQALTFAAAVAARTSRIGVGTGIMIAPLRPAIDIAEQVAIVDILSGGRARLGMGVGWRPREYEMFGRDMGDRYAALEQRASEIPQLWRSGAATPPPLQDELPIWIAAAGPRAARLAGRVGAGLLWLDPALMAPYREGLEAGGHPAERARVAGGVAMIVADDPERAWDTIAPHAQWTWQTFLDAAAEAMGGALPTGDQALPATIDQLRSPGPAMLPPVLDVVTPDEAIARLRAWLTGMPVSEGFFYGSIGGMPEELAHRHIELLGTVVAPAVADLGLGA